MYSFGVIMWELYSGCAAWAGLTHPQIIHAVAIAHQRLVFPREGTLTAHLTYFELAEVRRGQHACLVTAVAATALPTRHVCFRVGCLLARLYWPYLPCAVDHTPEVSNRPDTNRNVFACLSSLVPMFP